MAAAAEVAEINEKVTGLVQVAVTQILLGEMSAIDAKSQKPVEIQAAVVEAAAAVVVVIVVDHHQIEAAQIEVISIIVVIKDRCVVIVQMIEIGHTKQ